MAPKFGKLLFAISILILPLSALAQQGTAPSEEIAIDQALVIGPVGRYGRNAIPVDRIQAEIVMGQWTAPKAGDTLTLPDGAKRTWEAATAGKDGQIASRALEGGYAFAQVASDRPRVMILEAQAHSMVYVNGEPRAGDPYGYGYVRLPVQLRLGENEMLFACGSGRFHARLVAPPAAVLINKDENAKTPLKPALDVTLPDWRLGEKEAVWGAVVLLNTSTKPAARLALRAERAGVSPVVTALPAVPPLSARKLAFRLPGSAPRAPGDCPVTLQLLGPGGHLLDTAGITMRVRKLDQTYKRTFRSEIDGSLQYYAVNPAHPLRENTAPPALFLSLHGAGVEAIGQADAYESKPWGALVAPTNRRPFGFDWEDWGRLDALEVLKQAKETLHPDPRRIYLTGHSMGGHGTWQIGVTFPGLFAAIGPSAGWISFWSYAGATREAHPTPVQEMLQRASDPGDTLALGHNLAQVGVYILQGGADDNVPPEQARTMRDFLASFHHDFVYFEQPGVGHWWDISPEPGADCVDWAPMFDFFARHDLPADDAVREVDFSTADPGISAWSRWACIGAQTHALQLSSIHLRCDPGLRRFTGTTTNVARLGLRLDSLAPGQPISVDLDGQKIENIAWPLGREEGRGKREEGREKREATGDASQDMLVLWLAYDGKVWAVSATPAPALKGPQRYGPFKAAFRYRMVFVYGTRGTPEENAWAFAKARYDAETFWYRGNGSVDVMADTEFDAARDRDRSVILYGNADTNGAWSALLADSPVQVRNGEARIGERVETGEDL
ncbi:MAG TPA: prolyl oligopeptidase family serine peptidase, partial [Chthonomonadaceae bacterium]|nr:prolyl oligopeptidase family serine peptidase [Chthonomonadaceae bacterium]